jgi:hypothetical protein
MWRRFDIFFALLIFIAGKIHDHFLSINLSDNRGLTAVSFDDSLVRKQYLWMSARFDQQVSMLARPRNTFMEPIMSDTGHSTGKAFHAYAGSL